MAVPSLKEYEHLLKQQTKLHADCRKIDADVRLYEMRLQLHRKESELDESKWEDVIAHSVAADQIGVLPKTVKTWIEDGKLEGRQISPRKWAIPVADWNPFRKEYEQKREKQCRERRSKTRRKRE